MNQDLDDALAPLGDRHIGEMRDVPQEPYLLENGETNHNQIAIDAFRASTPADFDDRPHLYIEDGKPGVSPVTDEMVERGCAAWERVKYAYRSPADLVRAILEAALAR